MTLELAEDSPILELPWIITFGPLSDEEDWEPVVCGPYERAHAIALAEEIVADQELMAVVEPLLGLSSVDDIRAEIAEAKTIAAETDPGDPYEEDDDLDADLEFDVDGDGLDDEDDHVAGVPPTPDEVRAGMARIAQRLAGS